MGKFRGVYFNDKQIQFLNAPQMTSVYVGGRGGGKSYVLGGKQGVRAVHMPKAKFGLISITKSHLKNNVVPSMMRGIKSLGYKEHTDYSPGHFVMFKKPPENWAKPHESPETYEDVITFNNGYTIELVSTAKGHNADIIRGKNYDGLDIDEAGMGLDKQIFDSAIMPTVRGNSHIYEGNPFYGQISFYTSMPWLSQGKWLLDYEILQKQYPEEIFFIKCTSWDNEVVLGKKVLERWQREMNPLEYQVEIMCEEANSIPNSYYAEFDELKHLYTNPLYSHYYDFDKSQPIKLSFDFNAGFICCLVGQHIGNTLRIQRELFVKGYRIINDLIDEFCNELNDYDNPNIEIYGDPNGYKRNPNSKENYYDLIMRLLRGKGWQPKLKAIHAYPEHITRHHVINTALKQENTNTPIIQVNSRECPFLSTLLNKTPIKPDYTKDKRSEKDSNFPQERAPHLTDAFDYVAYPVLSNYIERKHQAIERPQIWGK